jgi:hypothetical protein
MKSTLKLECARLSGIMLTLLMLFSSCEHETVSPQFPVEDEDILTKAGELHNQMAAYYYAHRKNQETTPVGMFEEMLDLSSTYMISVGYNSTSIEQVRRAIQANFSPGLVKSTSEEKFSLDPGTFIPQLRATGLYSESFLEAIDEILNLGENQAGRQAIRRYVNTVFNGIRFAHQKDREAQQLFVKIFNSSYQFWESYDSSYLKGTLLRESSWVIINDGIGGLLGLVFGPAGSIITGTIFSLGTNEEINR